MNPELTATLAARRARELTARPAGGRVPAGVAGPRAGRRLLPRYRVTWTRISLALTDDDRSPSSSSSWAIVISASKPARPAEPLVRAR